MRRYVRNVLKKTSESLVDAHPDFDFTEQSLDFLLGAQEHTRPVKVDKDLSNVNLEGLVHVDLGSENLKASISKIDASESKDFDRLDHAIDEISDFHDPDVNDSIQDLEDLTADFIKSTSTDDDWSGEDVHEYEDDLVFDPWEFDAPATNTLSDFVDDFELDIWDVDTKPNTDYEQTADSDRLDGMAADLVMQLDSLCVQDRPKLHRRLRDILSEFPFAASYHAMKRLISQGISVESLEEICALKCLWRDCDWLWLRRRYDKMQGLWRTQRVINFRHALNWKVAQSLLSEFSHVEVEDGLTDGWLKSWLSMKFEESQGNPAAEIAFFSYSYFVIWRLSKITFDETSYDPLDQQNSFACPSELKIFGEDGVLIWQFNSVSNYRDTGYLSLLPYRQRQQVQETVRAKELALLDRKADNRV